MFRDTRRRSRRLRFASAMSMAAAALVIIGGIAGAAYAAVLPAPVQHIAYRMLGRIGVPDTPSLACVKHGPCRRRGSVRTTGFHCGRVPVPGRHVPGGRVPLPGWEIHGERMPVPGW